MGYYKLDDKIAALNRLKTTEKGVSLDAFCEDLKISRRTLTRWAKALGFDLKGRHWFQGRNAISLSKLHRGDYNAAGKRAYLTTRHALQSQDWLSKSEYTCARCRWQQCPVRQEGEADCVIIDERRRELQDELENHPYVDEASALAVEWMRAGLSLTLVEIAYRSFGPFWVDEGVISLQEISRWEVKLRDQLIRLSDALGLSPDSKRRIATSQAAVMDVASRVARMRRENAK